MMRHKIRTVWFLGDETTRYRHCVFPQMHCEFTEDNAFNVIQRRMDGTTNFALPLSSYIAGFGVAQGNYWVGLNTIHYLTMQQGQSHTT